jgi:CheY-like chemotaxis protein
MQAIPGRSVLPQGHSTMPPADEATDMDIIALVVENDPDVLFATAQKIEAWGASALCAASTDAALELVRDIGMAPDIILADYQLDGEDTGIRAIQSVREATGLKVPAIMITADRSDDLLRAGAEIGFAVLTKPVQVSRLRPLIDWKIRWQSPEPSTQPGPPAQTPEIASPTPDKSRP